MGKRPPEFYFERARELAKQRGGEMLSPCYLGDKARHEFRCEHGHLFTQTPGDLLQGRWCRECRIVGNRVRRRPAMLARLREIVDERGGVLLSDAYVNQVTPLPCRCAEGHEWSMLPITVFQGRWCPACGRKSQGRALAAHARERVLRAIEAAGYEVLAPGYTSAHEAMELKCPRGHSWSTLPGNFETGARCPRCRTEDYLGEARALARERGGELLSASVRNRHSALQWRCALGHDFGVSLGVVARGGWCGRCHLPAVGNIERMRRIARSREGECLSTDYVDAFTKLGWRCRDGHEWLSEPNGIIQGTWCPICTRREGNHRPRLTLEIMKQMAWENGGECEATSYHGNKAKLMWRCARGHRWLAIPARIRQGDWCPECSHLYHGTIEGMRELAYDRGGRCLSPDWDNHREPLTFECAEGHRFELNPKVAKTGVWCPVCHPRPSRPPAEA